MVSWIEHRSGCWAQLFLSTVTLQKLMWVPDEDVYVAVRVAVEGLMWTWGSFLLCFGSLRFCKVKSHGVIESRPMINPCLYTKIINAKD